MRILSAVQATIGLIPRVVVAKNGKKLMATAVVRTMANTGLIEDQSKYIYTLTSAGAKIIDDHIQDHRWIKEVQVAKDGVDIVFEAPKLGRQTLPIPAICFRDNDGQPLLANLAAKMSSPNDFYQAEHYTPETEQFAPIIGHVGDNWRLIVHRVDKKDVALPTTALPTIEALTQAAGPNGQVIIHPAATDALVHIDQAQVLNGARVNIPRYIPVGSPEDLAKLPGAIDFGLSRVVRGDVVHGVSPQTRFVEKNNLSSKYIRDNHFYWLPLADEVSEKETIVEAPHGQNHAINRGKGAASYSSIESGRGHEMWRWLLYSPFMDALLTNNPFYRKLSDHAHHLGGPGASEDTQKEIALRLRGLRMWCISEMTSIMPAEKDLGKYKTQNCDRYIYSEVLFDLATKLFMTESWERFMGKSPIFTLRQGQAILAGRTWYKVGVAKIIDYLATPIYLLTFGYIPVYPVDLNYFLTAWAAKSYFATRNYFKQINASGFGGFATGLWKNVLIELTFLQGYLRSALWQRLMRYQFGPFRLTFGASGTSVPDEHVTLIKRLATISGTSLALAAVSLTITGAISWIALPLALATTTVAITQIAKGYFKASGWKRVAQLAGGVLLGAVGATATAALAPILFTNVLSIGVVANVGFGIYTFALLLRSLWEITLSNRELEFAKEQKNDINPATGQKYTVQERMDTARDEDHKVSQLQTAKIASLKAARSSLIVQGTALTYKELKDIQSEIRQTLKDLGGMDKKGRILQGVTHPNRYAIFGVLEINSIFEQVMTKKALRSLLAEDATIEPGGTATNVAEARAAIFDLIKTSHSYIILNFIRNTLIRFKLKLE